MHTLETETWTSPAKWGKKNIKEASGGKRHKEQPAYLLCLWVATCENCVNLLQINLLQIRWRQNALIIWMTYFSKRNAKKKKKKFCSFFRKSRVCPCACWRPPPPVWPGWRWEPPGCAASPGRSACRPAVWPAPPRSARSGFLRRQQTLHAGSRPHLLRPAWAPEIQRRDQET